MPRSGLRLSQDCRHGIGRSAGRTRDTRILAWIVVGLIAGWLASMVMRVVATASSATSLLLVSDAVSGINVTSILVAFIGAVILIAILRAVSGRRTVWSAQGCLVALRG